MSHVEEKWEDVKDFPNYAVSNYGTVINKNTNRELKPWRTPAGYLTINLYYGTGKKKKRFLLHRLVAEAFFLNYSDGHAVVFENNNFEDCSVKNITLSVKKCRLRES